MNPQRTIFLAMPYYGAVEPRSARAFWLAGEVEGKYRVAHAMYGISALVYNFNTLWAWALNQRKDLGITHFAMLHSDMAPRLGRDDPTDRTWLEILFDELQETGADVVSAVSPIKDFSGLTSTAIDVAGGEGWEPERRLAMREVHQLPETFSATDCGYPDRALLVNTGCWICDFTKPWVEGVEFVNRDGIRRNHDGSFEAKFFSEDWGFSRQLHALGCKVLATRKVVLNHIGAADFGNDRPWGDQAMDHVARGRTLPSLQTPGVKPFPGLNGVMSINEKPVPAGIGG